MLLSLKTVNYWNFTWNEFVSSLPEDWDCVQLLLIRDEIKNIYESFSGLMQLFILQYKPLMYEQSTTIKPEKPGKFLN